MIILDNIVFSLQRAGGVSVVWQQILKSLVNNPNVKDYICLEYPLAEENLFRADLWIPEDHIKKISGPTSFKRYVNPMLKIEEPTIFHSSYYRTQRNPLVRNITTVHDFTYELLSKSGIRRFIHQWQKKSAMENSEVIVCISKNTVKDLISLYPSIDKNRVRIIYNGVGEEYGPIDYDIEDNSDSVLFVGMRGGYKNFRYVVDSLSSTKYKLIICGSPLTKEEQEYLDNSLGSKRYRYEGRVSNERLNELYNSVHCLAYPSSYEGFGIPVLEAQRAKCPVIALNASSIPEVMGPKEFLLDELSISAFKERLNILENDKVRSEITEQGLDFSNNFSWKKMASEYMELYDELLRK